MTEENRKTLPDHPIRVALLDLLAEVGTLTSTQAAARLGHSSGLCSFHLRQLAAHGLIEEAPRRGGGRSRPWRLRWGVPEPEGLAEPDESYRRWLSRRDSVPEERRYEDGADAVLHLTPRELAELTDELRGVLDRYRHLGPRPDARRVGAVTRVFPLVGSPNLAP
ncbi:hypothetical protein SRB5_38570 [Streptomyces sp. RB5]|uniref:ArsR family transcriptional regulator n=1 Tax=Streptomyces smaragdinus TaxID=2585196 RepID=A0A7K0CJR7_9ACTN|nr:winged helix-turn-helix domain-containing protein [Streptomyces smaragdinus]MQY13707.1 hypothetical protein [Streptomyces smaragdinus]